MSYRGLTAALATQHAKERAIAPAFAERLGLAVRVASSIDTDALGTFTGEVPRAGSMREAARAKARLGMQATGLPMGIASEGSFGPHPFMPFIAAGREMMIFIDVTRGLEVVEECVSETTNFAALELTEGADIEGFLDRAGFPSHALVLRRCGHITKGINDRAALESLLSAGRGEGWLETDMRAHVNPTRMAEIGKLAAKLAARIATPCPACAAPGFGTVRSEAGLPCAACETPTAQVRSLISGCALCGYEQSSARPDGRTAATPAECPECNP
ncbi:MAG: hypothetical protein IOC82_12925 [Aestuariivirga sp.]|uniref:DUF6671 family protein n=1 Tax=Aestuariivirga sp. TaxID=2650926 RepID=UPI0025BD37CB|nr:DUF6671 family protein [Aestuariivirga sp.]MCA3561920.1 hypothetical protein [Aestuariivirga sp.]